MSEPENSVDTWLCDVRQRMLDESKAGAAPKAETLTVREFLDKFGNARRGYRVVGAVQRKLDKYHLCTSPNFEFEYIDNPISIELVGDVEAKYSDKKSVSLTVRADSLEAAHNKPICVGPNDLLVRATTIMRYEGFSQLPVTTTERDVKGVISWRSIGTAYANGHKPNVVRECMEDAHEIGTNMTLADVTYAILKHDYVLVRQDDKIVSGIVTAADLADQFRQLAHPFLLIAEIEHHLRNFMRGRFTIEELTEAAKVDKEVKGPDDLTFGDYCHLLGREESWEKLDLHIDRKECIRRLEKVRNIRNDVMHFSPDGIEPGDIDQLEKFAGLLRQLTHM